MLTEFQEYVLSRMRAAGLEWVADATERAWKAGETYYIDSRCKASKVLRRDFMRANEQAESSINTVR